MTKYSFRYSVSAPTDFFWEVRAWAGANMRGGYLVDLDPDKQDLPVVASCELETDAIALAEWLKSRGIVLL
jgi:hypothetical protein